ncbi:MAG TPA: AzlD domain-containing protein [Actinomycetota bacterium]|nr:AzlD domain-containing protein [Actinomycetota bacterium]
MSDAWWTVVLVGVATIAIKGAGPLLMGGKPLPPRLGRVIGLLAPALLAALVAISTFGGDRALVLDERALGVAAAGFAVGFRAPPLVVVIVAATVTALARALL